MSCQERAVLKEFVGGDADDGAWVLRVGCQFVVYPFLSFTPSLSLFLFSTREKKGEKGEKDRISHAA